MNDEAFLAGLKPGDEVSVANERIERVTKLTPTQIVVGHSRFNRKTGRSCGTSGWHTSWLYPVSQQLREKIARREVLHALKYTDTSKVPTATLEAMVKLMHTALAELQP